MSIIGEIRDSQIARLEELLAAAKKEEQLMLPLGVRYYEDWLFASAQVAAYEKALEIVKDLS